MSSWQQLWQKGRSVCEKGVTDRRGGTKQVEDQPAKAAIVAQQAKKEGITEGAILAANTVDLEEPGPEGL